ncbi:putative protein MTH_421 [Methanobacterium sp. MB1]|jgi:preflagellin peptidase FlaK|uniref:A24 family peptidase C-terminal domain-containing protein n=1 Tax=Methanobacterium sp. TaxID=2164 RepID=UPI0003C9C136|nr:putative protein MTH_421 [Methanobacterium sp. MB1]
MYIDIPLITAMVAIVACLYASYTDLKSGIIPNKLTFPLIAIGLVLNGIYAFLMGEIWIIISCAVITGIIFVLGYLLWKMGAWAGGDVKLFTALAALIPFNPLLVSYQLFQVPLPVLGIYPFPLTVIINSILSILPFILIYVIYTVFKYKRELIDELTAPVRNYRKNIVQALVITSAVNISLFITQLTHLQIILISLIMIYLFSTLISKLPSKVKAVVVSVVIVVALFYYFQVTLVSIVILFVSINIVKTVIKLLGSVSKKALQDDVPLDKLREGMIPAYNVYQQDDDEIFVDDKSFTQKLKESFKNKDPSLITTPQGKRLVGTLAAGLTDKDIDLLKKLNQEDKIPDEFRIKKGVPFAPSIFIGLIISLFIGDLVRIIQMIVIWIL